MGRALENTLMGETGWNPHGSWSKFGGNLPRQHGSPGLENVEKSATECRAPTPPSKDALGAV